MGDQGKIDLDDDMEATMKSHQPGKSGSLSEHQRALVKWHRNVDKRYAWVILLALWHAVAATLGPYRVYGLIYAKVTNEGIYTREEASWPSSVLYICENATGPIVSIITYHLSYRQCFFIGGLMVTLGNGLTALSGSLLMDTILMGVVQGIGRAFLFMPFMAIINEYFLKYRSIAVGLALCGANVAIFILSPIFQWLVERYPWRYSYYGLGLVASITLFMVPLLRPNPRPIMAKRRKSAVSEEGDAATTDNGRPWGSGQRQGSVISIEDKPPHSITKTADCTQQKTEKRLSKTPPPPSKLAAEDAGWMNMSEFGAKQDTAAERADEDEAEEIGFGTMWTILKSPVFYMICYQNLCYYWVFCVYSLVLVDYGIDRGLTKEQATFLINFQSVGEILGRLVLTTLFDMQTFLSHKSVAILAFFVLASSICLLTIVPGFAWMAAATMVVMGLTALLYILMNGLVVKYFGERKVTLVYGMTACVFGVLQTFRPMIVGYFRDTLGSYDMLMLSLAVASAIGGLLWMIEPLVSRCCGPARSNDARN